MFSRIGLGLLLIASGAGLLINKSPAKALPDHLENLSKTLIVAKYLIPYSMVYYNLNALLFIVSGLFALINSPSAPSFYATAAVMFVATYDNPMLSRNEQDKYLRYVFIACHVCIFACLALFAGDKEEEDRKKAKAEKRKKREAVDGADKKKHK